MAKVITTELQHSGASAANITLDSSKNVTCENNLQVDGNVTVTGTLPADKLTGTLPAISGASLTNLPASPPAFRNMVHNGKMSIAQRATSVTGKSSNGYYVCDRYRNVFESVGTYSVSRVEDAPEGFVYSMKIDCTTASGTLSGSSRHYIEYRNESWNQQHLLFGTSNAKTTTLSFWVKCTKTGTFNVNLLNEGARTGSVSGTEVADKTIGKLVTISAANTWEKKTLTYVGDTAAFIRNNQHKGIGIRFILNAGSSYSGGTIQSTWAAGNNASYYTGNLAFGVSTDDDFYITGIQWEIGDSATDFEYRSFGDELKRCQRYYEKSYKYEHAPGTATDDGRRLRRVCASATNQTVFIEETYKVTKRATPSLTTYSSDGTSGEMFLCNYGSTSLHVSASVYGNCDVGFEVSGSGTANGAAVFWRADSEF